MIDVYVDGLLLDAGAWTTYDQASEELNRREAQLCAHISGPLTAEQERECDAIGYLDDRLEVQRLADWAWYGGALPAHIEVAAARLVELTVPVVVHVDVDVDVDTFRPTGSARVPNLRTLGDDLVEAAVKATPMPGNGVDRLRRLEATTGPSDGERL